MPRIPDGYHHGMLNLLGSHDTERVLTRHAGEQDAALLAYALLLSAEGATLRSTTRRTGLPSASHPGCRSPCPGARPCGHRPLGYGIRDLTRAAPRTPPSGAARTRVTAADADRHLCATPTTITAVAIVQEHGTHLDLDDRSRASRRTELGDDRRPR